jgi:uncharacterized protein (DUF2141 family)
LLAGCAQVRSLSGGEKDISAPLALSADPANLTTNFKSFEIEFEFDEYVQLNSIQQELIISPPQAKFPDVRVKQKSLFIKFNSELLPETTYQLNFGDGVVDVNENNKAENLIYVFSTGPVIDSLTAQGVVFDAAQGIKAEKYKVLLFENDTAVFSSKTNPIYFTKTKSDGDFLLSYLKAGSYSIAALDDKNSNYHWDPGEAIALLNDSIKIPLEDSTQLSLHASIPLPEIPDLSAYRADSTGVLRFPIDPHFQDVLAKNINGDALVSHHFNDSVFVVINGPISDSFEKVELSIDSIVIDTIDVPFFQSAAKNRLLLFSDLNNKSTHDESFNVYTDRPISLINAELIHVMCDSVSVPLQCELLPHQFGVKINTVWPVGKNAEVTVLPGALSTEVGATNDSLSLKTYRYKPEELGTIIFQFDFSEKITNPLIILQDKNGKAIFNKHILKSKTVEIKNLPPGDYTAKIVEDYNLNSLYDPIDLQQRTEPELTHLYNGKINVRSNWELKLNWKIN